MKKLIIILSFLLIGIVCQAQSFWKPVPKNLFAGTMLKAGATSTWLFRPSVEVTATQFTFTGDSKVFDVSTLSQAGIGISYQHFIEADGLPYNNLGFNILGLFGTDLNGGIPAQLSVAASVNFLALPSVGVGYNFTLKKAFLLGGIVFHFNK